jgi:phosphoribosylanthranilate isomerase
VTTVKVCGVTCVDDAELAIHCGVDAVGVNLIPTSKRVVDLTGARRIAEALAGRAVVVGVVADLGETELRELRAAARLDLLQLHGHEPPELVQALLPNAYKAIGIGCPADALEVERYPGERLLVDAMVAGQLGGTGKTFDWTLVKALARRRRLVLAGGLTSENVAHAVREVRPWGVDVASGVELVGQPRRKDPDRLQRFVQAVRLADA